MNFGLSFYRKSSNCMKLGFLEFPGARISNFYVLRAYILFMKAIIFLHFVIPTGLRHQIQSFPVLKKASLTPPFTIKDK